MIKGQFELMDEFSGIPLPLSPEYMAERSSRFQTDIHHPWHNRLDPLLCDLGGEALRASRVQRANYDAHHIDYHGSGLYPTLPLSDVERIRPIILAAAGYIPRKAIAFSASGEPYNMDLDAKARSYLWKSGLIRVEKPGKVRGFLTELVFNQGMQLPEMTIDKFLNAQNDDERWRLGNDLLGRAAWQATKPIAHTYREAYQRELIPAVRAREVARFVLGSLSMRRHRDVVIDKFRSRLVAA